MLANKHWRRLAIIRLSLLWFIPGGQYRLELDMNQSLIYTHTHTHTERERETETRIHVYNDCTQRTDTNLAWHHPRLSVWWPVNTVDLLMQISVNCRHYFLLGVVLTCLSSWFYYHYYYYFYGILINTCFNHMHYAKCMYVCVCVCKLFKKAGHVKIFGIMAINPVSSS